MKLKLKFLKIKNFYNNPINKTFTLNEDGTITKESNSLVSQAFFEEIEVDNLKDLDADIKKLNANECICLGASKHGFKKGYITVKGKEDLNTYSISRSNLYTVIKKIQGSLIDYDQDSQMPANLLAINEPRKLHECLIQLFGESFVKSSARYGYGSSYGIKKKNVDEPSSANYSMHGYIVFENFTDKSPDFLIEYIKRKSIELGLWFLKIHKDGSTSFRTIIDLSVIKSSNSRLIFEASATIGEGLEQNIPESVFYNCEDGIIPLDMNSLSLKGLADWKPFYEKEKIKQKQKIELVKEKYRDEAINELIQRYNYDPIKAKEIINKYLDTKSLSASHLIYASDNKPYSIHQYLMDPSARFWDVYDFLDPQKGLGKSKIYTNSIFDACITTYLRGGNKYQIIFDEDEILYILNNIKFDRNDINDILKSLIKYLINKSFSEKEVKKIIDVIKIKLPEFEFGKKYYHEVIEKKVQFLMKDFALLKYSGNVSYIDLTKDKLELYKRSDLSELFRNKSFYTTDPDDNTKKIGIKPFEKWSNSSYRKEYINIDFTDKAVDENTFNLFKGFPYKPIDHDDVDIESYFTLIREVICDNDEFLYMVVLSFIAQIIQEPFKKLGTSIVISGQKRTGKGSFIKLILKLLGETLSMQTSSKDDVFTRFNSHLMYKLFIYLNEAFWHGDKKVESTMKSLMTDDDLTYEIKNGPTFAGKNYSRMILDSNDELVVPATFDEGRYIALKASNCRKGDESFFAEVNDLRDNQKAMEKIMYFFTYFDYKPYEKYLRIAPKTKFFGEQISRNFEFIDEWWYSNLINGNIHNAEYNLESDGYIRISNSSLWESFKSYHGDSKIKYINESSFYKDIKGKFLDDIIVKKGQKMPISNENAKIIDSLSVCRYKFIQKNHINPFEEEINDWKISSKNLMMPQRF